MCCRESSTVYDTDMHPRCCKACTRPSSRLRDMCEFEKKLNMSIKACFSMLTAIDVKESDKICKKCLRRLMKCSEFVEMCEQVNNGQKQGNNVENLGTTSEIEIEEEIEGEEKEEKRVVKFEAPKTEEIYESDFEPQTSSDEGINEEITLRYYCTVCRKSFFKKIKFISCN